MIVKIYRVEYTPIHTQMLTIISTVTNWENNHLKRKIWKNNPSSCKDWKENAKWLSEPANTQHKND